MTYRGQERGRVAAFSEICTRKSSTAAATAALITHRELPADICAFADLTLRSPHSEDFVHFVQESSAGRKWDSSCTT